MPDVVSWNNMPDKGVTASRRPDLRSRQEEGAWPDKSLRREFISSG